MPDLLLDRASLERLTGTVQPKRMCAWLAARGWVFEAPARRGDIPKVDRDYYHARMSGEKPSAKQKRREGPRVDWMTEPAL